MKILGISAPFSLFIFIYGAIIVTAMCGLVEVAMQQSYRMSANDPQIQIAEDAASALVQGAALSDLVPKQSVLIDSSLKEFLVLYDSEGNPIVGNGYLGGKLLTVPKGVFDAAKASGESRLTLEPQAGVRIAAVIKPFVGREANGYALSGQNLREVEVRENNLVKIVLLAWSASLIALLAMVYLLHTR